MGISPKTETRCHNFSFFENLVFENRDGRNTINCGSAFQFLGKCPYMIGAPRALERLKCHSLGSRFNVPARTDSAKVEGDWPGLTISVGRQSAISLPFQCYGVKILFARIDRVWAAGCVD
jgi:hypothetical protein